MDIIYKKIAAIDYPISTKLFLDFIGSMEDLKALQSEVLRKTDIDLFKLNRKSVALSNVVVTKEDKNQIDELILKGFYRTIDESFVAEDFELLKENIYKLTYIHTHLFRQGEYNKSMIIVMNNARRMIAWGYRDVIIAQLNKYRQQMFQDKELWQWVKFLRIYCDIVPGNNTHQIHVKELVNLMKYVKSDTLKLEILNLLGIFYGRLKQYSTSLQYLHQGITLSEDKMKSGDIYKKLHFRMTQNYAAISVNGCNIDEAGLVFEQLIDLNANDDNYEVAKLFCNYGYYLRTKGNQEEAVLYFQKAKDASQKKYPDVELMTYRHLAEIQKEKGYAEEYFTIKKTCIPLSLTLYHSLYYYEFFECIHTINEFAKKKDTNITNGIRHIEDAFNDINYKDEVKFFKCIRYYLSGNEDFTSDMNSIRNQSLRGLLQKTLNQINDERTV